MLLSERYAHKIKMVDDLNTGLLYAADNTLVLCHGVFDVVHPGHLRHLAYAKSKADVLVVSITADKHVTKGAYRPHVPQEIRAANVAAFEFVDYVIVDENPTPIANILALRPTYFAKGFEYVSGNAATRAEADAVASYGGEMLFTPGDLVYSSSKLIDLMPPAIWLEKLQLLMHRYHVTFDKLRDTLRLFQHETIHVVGDTIVDSYTECSKLGSGSKTPTISARFERRVDFAGGAAVVAKHMKAAGAHKVILSSVVGDDANATFVLKDLEEADIQADIIVDASRPTVCKNAIVVDGYRLVKVDTLDNSSISDRVVTELCENLGDWDCDGVVFSDFRHGIFNKRTIPRLIKAIPNKSNLLKAADSQVASRWGNIIEFQGFDLITPNELEARFALGDQDSSIRVIASLLYQATRCGYLILKLGGKGALGHADNDEHFFVDSFADSVTDPVGAGDALLAYASLALLAGNGDKVQALILGSMAAATECEVDGNVPVTATAVGAMIDSVERQLT